MTTMIATLEPLAREMIEEEWRRLHRELHWRHSGCVLTEPPLHLVPDLLRMIDDHHDKPVRSLAPTVRELLNQQHFIDVNGDSILGFDMLSELERQTEIVLCVLERVRQRAFDSGQWSDAPMTTQWAG